MKRLMLIRHAKSSWKDPDREDFDRPLAKRGKNDALIMGRRLVERGERPSLIVSSPAKRALATMKRIVGAMGVTDKSIVRDERLYHAGCHELLDIVRGIEETHGDVILCGHNPGFTDFCNFVADSHIDNLPTCGVVSLDFAVDLWKEISESSGRIRYCDFPRNIRFAGADQPAK